MIILPAFDAGAPATGANIGDPPVGGGDRMMEDDGTFMMEDDGTFMIEDA